MEIRKMIADEIHGFRNYITIDTMFKGIKERMGDSVSLLEHLVCAIGPNNEEALILANEIYNRIKPVDDYISRYDAARDMDDRKTRKTIESLNSRIKELEENILEKDEFNSKLKEEFNSKLKEELDKLEAEYSGINNMQNVLVNMFKSLEEIKETVNAVNGISELANVADKLEDLKDIKETVNAVNGISEFIKIYNSNKQKAKATGKEATAYNKDVDDEQLKKDYKDAGNHVTKKLIEKYAGKLTKQGIIERLKSLNVYKGRETK